MSLSQTDCIAIVMPVYNDRESFALLVNNIEAQARIVDTPLSIIAVNDGSHQVNGHLRGQLRSIQHICAVEILHLYTNVGHQRAIAVGLVEVACRNRYDAVIVMDADGEDRPEELVKLLEMFQLCRERIIVAQRAKRSEVLVFKAFYALYKLLFLLFVGKVINFGNYCLIPATRLKALVYDAHIWNHLASTLLRMQPSVQQVKIARGKRYTGCSSMNLEALISHGLSAISVHIERVLVRVLVLSAVLLLAAITGIGVVVWIRLFTELAIPGWATNAVGILFIIVLQLLMLSLVAAFGVLNRRAGSTFLPALEAQKYIKTREVIVNNRVKEVGSDDR